MVFGEKLDTFDESRKDLLEFEKISLNYSMAVGVIGTAPPLYRYFPTKPYRDYRRAHDAMYEKGVVFGGFLYHTADHLLVCNHRVRYSEEEL